ncbi:Trichohyalin-plectin-homology domain-containing protein [Plasmodiophora brassicae]
MSGAPSINVDSPRTHEAMLRLGVLPDDIRPRTLASFAADNLLPEFQQQRKDVYDRKCQTLIGEIKAERDHVVEEERKEKMRAALKTAGVKSDSEERNRSEAIVAREQARLKKMEEAQKAEFQQFLEYEIKMQATRLANEQKMAKEHELEQQRLREKMERAREWDRQRKAKEEAKYQQELEELRRQELLAQEMFAEAQRQKEKEIAEAKRRKALAVQKEMERIQRQKEHEEELMRMQEEHEAAAREREMEIQKREDERLALLNAKREEQAAVHRAAAEALRQRVERVKEKDRERLEMKKMVFEKKTAKVNRRRARFEAKRAEEIQKDVEESQAHMKKVKDTLLANIQKYEQRKVQFEEKEQKARQRQEQIHYEREREAQRRKEMERMQREERFETIIRQQRAHEYKCKRIQEQILAENEVTKALKLKQAHLIEERRKIAYDARRQKEELAARVDRIKRAGQFNPQTLMREFNLTMPEVNTEKARPTPVPRRPKATQAKSEPEQSDDEEEEANHQRQRRAYRKKRPATSAGAVKAHPAGMSPSDAAKHLGRHASERLRKSRSTPKVGPLSRDSFKRLMECGHAYDIDMTWLPRPVKSESSRIA